MLLRGLGFCPPHADEERRIRALSGRWEVGLAGGSRPNFRVPAAVLSHDPLISYSGMIPNAPLGLASLAGTALRKRAAWFLLSPTWSIEEERIVAELRERAV